MDKDYNNIPANACTFAAELTFGDNGEDFFEVCKQRAEEEQFAADLGVQLAMGSPGQQTISQVESQVEESEAAPMEDGEDG
jgi:polysaccharide deacetylase 2 family uncharacterized protein YibQ